MTPTEYRENWEYLMSHNYKYLYCIKTGRGSKFRLQRDDGKRVDVSRKRLNELLGQERIKIPAAEDETEQTGKELYSGFILS